jgi:NAD-dependent SIR2 family protein deacetylase
MNTCRGYNRQTHEEDENNFRNSLRWVKLPYCDSCVDLFIKQSIGNTAIRSILTQHNKPFSSGLIKCTKCEHEKETNEFHIVRTTHTGYHPQCQQCLKDKIYDLSTIVGRLKSMIKSDVSYEELNRQYENQGGRCNISGFGFKEYLNNKSFEIVYIDKYLIFKCFN